MEKKIIINQIGKVKEISTDYYLGEERTKIDELLDALNEAKKQGATHIEFSGMSEYDDRHDLQEVTFSFVTIELESDEDFDKRKKAEATFKENSLKAKEKMELQELQRLKEKYEPKIV